MSLLNGFKGAVRGWNSRRQPTPQTEEEAKAERERVFDYSLAMWKEARAMSLQALKARQARSINYRVGWFFYGQFSLLTSSFEDKR